VENSLWNTLWTCRETDYGVHEPMCHTQVWSQHEEQAASRSLLVFRYSGKRFIVLPLSGWNKSRGIVPVMGLKAKQESNAFQTTSSRSREYSAGPRLLTEIYCLYKDIFLLTRHVVARMCAQYWHIRSSREEICSINSYRGWRWMIMANRVWLLWWRKRSLFRS
jgi:hypothetical protein